MYTRQPSDPRNSQGLRIPGNYSGNAFRNYHAPIQESPPEPEAPFSADFSDTSDSEKNDTPSAKTVSDGAAPSGIGKLFGRGGGGIGFEELLILGLVLLVSQNDSKDDLAFLLLLLLFIQ